MSRPLNLGLPIVRVGLPHLRPPPIRPVMGIFPEKEEKKDTKKEKREREARKRLREMGSDRVRKEREARQRVRDREEREEREGEERKEDIEEDIDEEMMREMLRREDAGLRQEGEEEPEDFRLPDIIKKREKRKERKERKERELKKIEKEEGRRKGKDPRKEKLKLARRKLATREKIKRRKRVMRITRKRMEREEREKGEIEDKGLSLKEKKIYRLKKIDKIINDIRDDVEHLKNADNKKKKNVYNFKVSVSKIPALSEEIREIEQEQRRQAQGDRPTISQEKRFLDKHDL